MTLQHDTLEGVVADEFYYGSTVGRVCNRIYGAAFSGERSLRTYNSRVEITSQLQLCPRSRGGLRSGRS